MASYNSSAEKILHLEGGYSSNVRDKGNYICSPSMSWATGSYPFKCSSGELIFIGSMRGISAPVFASYLGRIPTITEMKALSKQTALSIYKINYWDRMKGDFIANQSMAEIVFDGCVNHGVSRGIKILQKVLGLKESGIMDGSTLTKLNMSDPNSIFDQYKEERLKFYELIVSNNPSQSVFLNGWVKRIQSFKFSQPDSSFGIIAIVLALSFIALS